MERGKGGVKKGMKVREICMAGVVAAVYAALTLVLSPISFGAGGAFQLRIAEGLTLLPCLFPAAVPGLFVGCFTANLLAGAPLYDVLVGSIATLLAAVCTRYVRRNVYLAALMPVLFNVTLVGSMLSLAYGLPLFYAWLTVLPGEAAACFLMGIPLMRALENMKWS